MLLKSPFILLRTCSQHRIRPWRILFPVMQRLFTIAFVLLLSVSARSQNFAFLNSKEAADACKIVAQGRRMQAIAMANSAMSLIPHARRHLHMQGLLPHKGIRDESETAARDFPAARNLAVGYCVTGNPDYRDHALRILNAWLSMYRPSYNPIDERVFIPLYLAADILRASFPEDTEAAWQAFNTDMAQNYLAQADSAASADNWQSERVRLATLAAFSTGDWGLIDHAQSAYTQQLSNNIRSNGTVADYTRHDALRAVVEDLDPLVMAALAAHNHGVNWYGIAASTGANLGMAIGWLAPYASGARSHQEYVNSEDSFDYARHNAGEPGFSGTWNPGSSAELFLMASALDRQWAQIATVLSPHPTLWQRMMLGMP